MVVHCIEPVFVFYPSVFYSFSRNRVTHMAWRFVVDFLVFYFGVHSEHYWQGVWQGATISRALMRFPSHLWFRLAFDTLRAPY